MVDEYDDGGWAEYKRPYRNPLDYATVYEPSARAQADAAGYETPEAIRTVLAKPERYAQRFTPFQWMVICYGYGTWSGYRTNSEIASWIGDSTASVRAARKAALGIANELVWGWDRACRKWHRIRSGNPYDETLTDDERRLLDKHRKAKSGTKSWGMLPDEPRRYRTGHRSGIPFSELSAGARRAFGIGDEFAPD
jgi:hypothetical protein